MISMQLAPEMNKSTTALVVVVVVLMVVLVISPLVVFAVVGFACPIITSHDATRIEQNHKQKQHNATSRSRIMPPKQ